jgi:hypothetical protein
VRAPAAESHDFGVRLESPLVADLDASSAISGRAGESIPFSILLDLGTTMTESDGVQGWSLGVEIGGFDIESVSTDGTVAAVRSLGGALDAEGGFLKFDIIDPRRNDERRGVVQAAVLSALHPVVLPPGHRYPLGRVRCKAVVGDEGRVGFARYQGGLVGEGQPVAIVVTSGGSSVQVASSLRAIAIGSNAEVCDDGIDNDGDGLADGGDPECPPPIPGEVCGDGADNDGDGAADCADSECFFRPPCPPSEICGDGIDNERDGDADCDDGDCKSHPFCLAREDCHDGADNDNDGLADCEDRDCGGIPPCPVIERCADLRDDDGDGLVDCDDPDCLGSPFCGSFEFCADGQDNNGDGLADCEDPQCAAGPACVDPEDCDDGVDDDGDGRVDCEDSQCAGVGGCPGTERCGDGRDNDRDGATDCDDADCRRHPLCIDPEICDDGVDNDGDGSIDCDDFQCRGRGPCPGPEDCRDSIDNDGDGLADCEDPQCAPLSHCRRSEDCDDGVDNDVDGLVDCDDPQCAGRDGCGVETCDNGIDDDGDGRADCDDPACWHRSPCGGEKSGFELVLVTAGAVRENREAEGAGAGGAVDPRTRVPTYVVELDYLRAETIEVITYIVPFPVPQADGIQGWSLSISHDADLMDVIGAPTIEGTDAGEFFSGGFEKTEAVGGAGGGAGGRSRQGRGAGASDGDEGVVSAVVLSFTQPSVLDPAIAQSILRTTYELNHEVGIRRPALIRFRDGLRGSGQPVSNHLTVGGGSAEPVHLVPLEIHRASGPFVRGDVNADGKVDIADAIWALNDLMRGGPPALCTSAADVNDDGAYDIADAIYLVQYEFLHGPAIPAPFPSCGVDPEEDALPCPTGAAPRC